MMLNDQNIQLEYLISSEGDLARTNIFELNHSLNEVRFSAIKNRSPIVMLKEKLKNLEECASTCSGEQNQIWVESVYNLADPVG